MAPLHHLLLALHLGTLGVQGTYTIIADAGSTGTRVYLFTANRSGEGALSSQDLGKGPALSSFQDSPERAAEAVRPQLLKAREKIPEAAQASVPVYVFATAGMRLVPKEAAKAIYDGLRQGILNEDFPFSREHLHARTISGREEGVFALLSANYLASKLHENLELKGTSLMGVLDLGGSSTQVAAPPTLDEGEHLASKLGSEHTFVRSFLKLGMERMRQRTYQAFVDAAPAALQERRAVPNPCSFYGYREDQASELWRGTGHASACQEAIAEELAKEKESCAAASHEEAGGGAEECLGARKVPTPQGAAADARFFLISGYQYVTEFARWWMGQPEANRPSLPFLEHPSAFATASHNMSIAELRKVADIVCAATWEDINAAHHNTSRTPTRFTKKHKVPHRCFEMNYIVSLLSAGYGFSEDEKLFRIAEEEIEWTLGAFLHSLGSEGSDMAAQEL